MDENNLRLKNRDLSWLAFNHRVLQEAADPRVPLYERIKFLSIFSSNLDEFFRVRVASIRALLNLKQKTKRTLEFDPAKLLRRIHKVVFRLQVVFGNIFNNQIKKELNQYGIYLIREKELTESQRKFVRLYFRQHVQNYIRPIFLSKGKNAPFLENRYLYLAVLLRRKSLPRNIEISKKECEEDQYALLEIPTAYLPRFLVLPHIQKKYYIMFLDDVIRLNLSEVFPHHQILGAYAIKLTRDAELHIEDEFSGDLLEKIKKALRKRKSGVPSRFLYYSDMPKRMLLLLKEIFSLNDDDLIAGGRYHNYNDFFDFPNPKLPNLTYEPLKSLMRGRSKIDPTLFTTLKRKNLLLHFPYHSFKTVIDFLREATRDPQVTSIKITLYRIGQKSHVIEQLMQASHNGKSVTAFVEVKARFDEESNIYWAEELEKSGVRILYSFPELKVHAKLCLISRKEKGGIRNYAYLSTGNFNENAARVYVDCGFFTADENLTNEVSRVFKILGRGSKNEKFKHLLVSPFNMRERFVKLIDREIINAQNGKYASIIAKLNNLEDPSMISKLYEASEAGVKIFLIVRSICCLIPGMKGMSKNIEVLSIVDRFLEHSRIYYFENGGEGLFYLSSADWMRRNLDRRIEVAFPIHEPLLQQELRTILDFYLKDNTKARMINRSQNNNYRKTSNLNETRAQYDIYAFLRNH